MYYYTRESQDAAALAKIKEYRTGAELYPIIKEVINAYDHKVLNKRLQTAIQERTGARLYLKQYADIITLEKYGNRGDVMTLMRISKQDLTDGKRIDAGKMIESLTERRNDLLKRAASFERQMEQIDAAKDQIEQLKRQLETITKMFDYTILDIYGMNYSMRR